MERVWTEQHEDWRHEDRGLAYGYAEADEHRRWGMGEGGLRPSPPHPWATDRYGYLTWSGKFQSQSPYAGYSYDRYSGGDIDCQNGCGPAPPPLPRP